MDRDYRELGKLANDAYRRFVTKNEAVKAMCEIDMMLEYHPAIKYQMAELMWEAIDAYEDNSDSKYFK